LIKLPDGGPWLAIVETGSSQRLKGGDAQSSPLFHFERTEDGRSEIGPRRNAGLRMNTGILLLIPILRPPAAHRKGVGLKDE
jgi:hypothetical protein